MTKYTQIKVKPKWSKYLKPREEQVATEFERNHAKEIAVKLQGQYGYPKLKKS